MGRAPICWRGLFGLWLDCSDLLLLLLTTLSVGGNLAANQDQRPARRHQSIAGCSNVSSCCHSCARCCFLPRSRSPCQCRAGRDGPCPSSPAAPQICCRVTGCCWLSYRRAATPAFTSAPQATAAACSKTTYRASGRQSTQALVHGLQQLLKLLPRDRLLVVEGVARAARPALWCHIACSQLVQHEAAPPLAAVPPASSKLLLSAQLHSPHSWLQIDDGTGPI